MLGYHSEGSELITLHSLWRYCRENTEQRMVVYLHSKGSYSPTPSNDNFRRFLTTGALSDECSSISSSSCNVCGSRMSPLPHPHIPGNMWSAKCHYVRDLIDPMEFKAAMEKIELPSTTKFLANQPIGEESCKGIGRFAAEHWILSHPANRPFDLFVDPSYTWSYDNIPYTLNSTSVRLEAAPRFAMETYKKKNTCVGKGTVAQKRLNEYMMLYGTITDENWWGWSFFNKSYAETTLRVPEEYRPSLTAQR